VAKTTDRVREGSAGYSVGALGANRSGSIEDERYRYCLRFVVGPAAGREVHILPDETLTIGRSEEADIVLLEELVSRNQARIVAGTNLRIEDLGSTNGTMVNGRRVAQAVLCDGDSVIFGASAAVVETHVFVSGKGEDTLDSAANESRAFVSQYSSPGSATMSGILSDVALPDLLQLFSVSKKSCLISIVHEREVGNIFVRAGIVESALINDSGHRSPLKNFIRILGWEAGLFAVHPLGDWTFEDKIGMSIEATLMESMRQQDELAIALAKLPADSRVKIIGPTEKSTSLSDAERRLLEIVGKHDRVQACLDASDETHLATANRLLALLSQEHLTQK